jgi:hypothetical protein
MQFAVAYFVISWRTGTDGKVRDSKVLVLSRVFKLTLCGFLRSLFYNPPIFHLARVIKDGASLFLSRAIKPWSFNLLTSLQISRNLEI